MRNLIFPRRIADTCAQFVVRAAFRPLSIPVPCLELVRDAFTEAGFLAVDRRPLKVRRFDAFSQRTLNSYMDGVVSYTERSSIRTTAAQCRGSGVFPAVLSQGSLPPGLISARGRQTSCRYVR
jgi:hypothetical protein